MHYPAAMLSAPSDFPDLFPLPSVSAVPLQTQRPDWDILTGRFAVDARYGVLRQRGIREHILLATTAGAGLVLVSGGWRRTVPGSLVILTAGHPHYYATCQASGAWEFTWAHFFPRPHWSWLHHWSKVAPGMLMESGLPSAGGFSEVTLMVLEKMHHRRLVGGALADDRGLNALEELLLEHTPSGRQAVTDERVLRVMDRVIAEPAAPHTVASMAGLAGVSASRFAHLFREKAGESPQQFVERVRLETAASALVAGGRTVGEIARSVGYTSPFHFSRRFKARFGMSPSQYRG